MGMIRDAMEPYWLNEPYLSLGSSGPSRVADEPDPNFKPRPVGFTARLEPVEVEPVLWEGDGA